MQRFIRKRIKEAGLPPGTLVHVGEKKTERTTITVLDYDEHHLKEHEIKAVEQCLPFTNEPTVTWINVEGLHEVGVIGRLGDCFGLHPLVGEDIVNTDQRPKMEDFDEYVYIVLKMLNYNGTSREVTAEQVSLILGPNFVITFQEQAGDVFDPIRERIKRDKGRIRHMGADYLAYALLDALVDDYFTILEVLGERIEFLEDELVSNPTTQTLQEIHRLKREMMFLRKAVWPLREVIGSLERGESPLFKKTTEIYLRDVYDHTIRVMDAAETFRDMLAAMLDIYLSSVSNRMNEVMKTLTVITTLFMPVSFLVGFFGMNFFQPVVSLDAWTDRPAFVLVIAVMVVVPVSMYLWMRKRAWM